MKKIEILKKQKLIPVFFYVLLISSLPFFSIRPSTLPISIPLIILLITSFFSCLIIILKKKYLTTNLDFDALLFLFIFFAAVFSFPDNFTNIAFIKSIVYFFSYILLKQLMLHFDYKELIHLTTLGIFIGTTTYIILIIYVVNISGGILSLFSDLSYHGFTIKIYQAISTQLLSKDDLESADIMRNSLGEVFSFYSIFMLIRLSSLKRPKRLSNTIVLWVNFGLVLVTFSRRAFFSIALTFFIANLRRGKVISKVINSLIFISLLFVFFFIFSGDSRITNIESDSRSSQYFLALDNLSNNPLIGHGYGTKITHNNKEKYIHNFILASWYMMGLLGLVISLVIYLYIIKHYFSSIIRRRLNYSSLLIIPILGMTVGGTVEGMFTLTSWIIFAIYGVLNQNTETKI